ncbi:vancomycin resistance protein YoaR [Paenibacillus cellulosilyticus]|uniref:Vancomycin resistance protein YoaR n=1 Tax=Paenibacillus cellulosilyticus TaxID=375489 RepID=A0A2V2YXW4_9BACL|nr:VanW family protein [Paenibacillus cellulosilyticus]PWW05730.1 vancomycin resistance protein YoaR [Paenibacillus cellulosilyticus]QKS45257.1 VanW family protein [Paenibacillus cellulosilyticus]
MFLSWLTVMIMLMQQPQPIPVPYQPELPKTLAIVHQGQTIATIDRRNFSIAGMGSPFVNEPQVDKLTTDVARRTDRPAVNAKLDGAGRIISERAGARLDRALLAETIYRFMIEGGRTQVEVPQLPIYPKVDSELLAQIKEKSIGHYATYYNSNNKNRSHNISLAASAINNTVVFPGETFSFNAIVGKRTTEKGYMKAPVIVRGEVSEDIGGGICQISSTLFNAADRAGLHIVQRYSHSRNVPYVPPGRDATVSWYGPDFVFQNKYSLPVLIRAFAQHGQVHVSIYSNEMIHYKPREVPHASKQLPEEVPAERGVQSTLPSLP